MRLKRREQLALSTLRAIGEARAARGDSGDSLHRTALLLGLFGVGTHGRHFNGLTRSLRNNWGLGIHLLGRVTSAGGLWPRPGGSDPATRGSRSTNCGQVDGCCDVTHVEGRPQLVEHKGPYCALLCLAYLRPWGGGEGRGRTGFLLHFSNCSSTPNLSQYSF